MSSLVPVNQQFAGLPQKIEYCRFLVDADMFPDNYRKKPANVLVAWNWEKSSDCPNYNPDGSLRREQPAQYERANDVYFDQEGRPPDRNHF